ncbi:MAG: hypothetical protein HC888_02955, partial [Candidatus Competibacteraceae bacterium]|nr:hypothetical protein [Candidatus Competibacteraceae bacterium]
MNPPTALLLLMVAVFASTASGNVPWTNVVKAIGLATDSNEFRAIAASLGHSLRSQSGKCETLDFEASGIAFKSEGGQVVEVELQLAPGKAIPDVGYNRRASHKRDGRKRF